MAQIPRRYGFFCEWPEEMLIEFLKKWDERVQAALKKKGKSRG